MQQQVQLAQAQHHSAAVAASLMQQKHREGMKGHCLLKLMQFGEHLSGFPVSVVFSNPFLQPIV